MKHSVLPENLLETQVAGEQNNNITLEKVATGVYQWSDLQPRVRTCCEYK